MAAFSSTSGLSFSIEDVDFRGFDGSPSVECRGVTSGRLRADFSDNCVGGGASSTCACFSAMAKTAASTFFSNSSSEIVNVVRSRFSMNCTAPSLSELAEFGTQKDINLPVTRGSIPPHQQACPDF